MCFFFKFNLRLLSEVLFLSELNEILFLTKDFRKYLDIKFQENPSIGSRFVLCGKTDGRTDGRTDGWTDTYMMKLIVAFRN